MATLIGLLLIVGAAAYGAALALLAPRPARLIAVLGIAGAAVYGVALVSLAAAQEWSDAEPFLWLALATLPLVVIGAVGYAWTMARPRVGGAVMLFAGTLLTLWGYFIWIDVGPGWFLSGLAVVLGGFATLKQPMRRAV
jgi:hypothetical protein